MDWTVTSDQSWCTVTPSSGNQNGSFAIMVSANTTTTDRSATVTVSASSGDNTDTKTIAVTQKGKELATLTLSISTFETDDKEGSQSVEVTSNMIWTITSDQSWCTVSPDKGSQNGSFNITVTANDATTDRKATVTVTAGSGDNTATKTIAVTQKGKELATLTLSISTFDTDDKEGSQSVEVTSNMDWTVTSDQGWCTVSPLSGSQNGSFVITVSANTTTTDRRATVTVAAGSGDNTDTKTITILQKGKNAATLTLSISTFETDDNGGSQSVEVTSNMDWTVTSDQGWCTVSPLSGSQNGSFAITVSANTTASDRKATVTITAGSGDNTATKTIAVTQKAPVTGGNDGLEEDDEIINL